jgi:hypothetical protein
MCLVAHFMLGGSLCVNPKIMIDGKLGDRACILYYVVLTWARGRVFFLPMPWDTYIGMWVSGVCLFFFA